MELKKVSELPNVASIKLDDLLMLIKKDNGILISSKITLEELKNFMSIEVFDKTDAPKDGKLYGRKDGKWVVINECSCTEKSKLIDLTDPSIRRLTISDYEYEHQNISDFSDMMFDFLKKNGIADYTSDNYQAKYISLVDTSDFSSIEPVSETGADLTEFFQKRGFVEDAIKTVHIIDKRTSAVVAEVKYLAGDNHYHFCSSFFEPIATHIKPQGIEKQYYIDMLNYGLANGVTINENGEEYPARPGMTDESNSLILKLLGHPFDKKSLQLVLYYVSYLDESMQDIYLVNFVYGLDYPTGVSYYRFMNCYGSNDWVIK